jgi:hypothetical protein
MTGKTGLAGTRLEIFQNPEYPKGARTWPKDDQRKTDPGLQGGLATNLKGPFCFLPFAATLSVAEGSLFDCFLVTAASIPTSGSVGSNPTPSASD